MALGPDKLIGIAMALASAILFALGASGVGRNGLNSLPAPLALEVEELPIRSIWSR